MAVVAVQCPECGSGAVVKYGKQPNGEQGFGPPDRHRHEGLSGEFYC